MHVPTCTDVNKFSSPHRYQGYLASFHRNFISFFCPVRLLGRERRVRYDEKMDYAMAYAPAQTCYVRPTARTVTLATSNSHHHHQPHAVQPEPPQVHATATTLPGTPFPSTGAPPQAARKPKKARDSASPAVDDANRRRSGRARGGNNTYMERDSDDDEDEMLEGVAKWDYYDEDGNVIEYDEDDDDDSEDESGSEEGGSESDQENGEKTNEKDNDKDNDEKPEAQEEEVEEQDEVEEEPEPEPEPAKTNGRRGRAAAAASPKTLPSRPAASKAAAVKGAKAKLAAAPTRAPSGRSTRGRRAAAKEEEEGEDGE